MKTFLSLMNRIPPAMAVLIAREGRRPMSITKVAQRANLSVQRVVWITSQTGWGDVPAGEASSLLAACGVTPSTLGRQLQYIKRASRAKSPLSKRLQQRGASRLLATLSSQQASPATHAAQHPSPTTAS